MTPASNIKLSRRSASRELYVLGTASQVPTRHRNHNGYFLRWDKEGILFDPGEGAQRQLIIAGLSVSAITRICITHFHGDHCLGLPGIIQRLSLENVPLVSVYYPASGQVYFDRLRRASIFAGMEKLAPFPIEKEGILFEDESFILEAAALSHEVDCYGFRVRERDRLSVRQDRLDAVGLHGPAVGQLLKSGKMQWNDRTVRRHEVTEVKSGQSFAFIMDTRPCEGARTLALGADLLVCEATFLSSESELANETGHMTAHEAAQLAREAGSRTLVLGHFSQRYEDVEAHLSEAQAVHKDVRAAVEPDPLGQTNEHRIPVPARRGIRFHGKFEAHITVIAADPAEFNRVCTALGVKCILIELAEGASPNQPMTESYYDGDLNVVRAEVDGLAEQFEEAGFTVLRRKIEARYDAEGIPESDDETRGLPASCYFEYHILVHLAAKEALKDLISCASSHHAHVSRNAKKGGQGEPEQRFVTLRVPRAGRKVADQRFADLLQNLGEHGFEIIDQRREFTVYDSNLDLDRGWLCI